MDCFLEEHPVGVEDLRIFSCRCGRIRNREHWNAAVEDLSKTLASLVKVPYELKPATVEVKPSLSESRVDFTITIRGVYHGGEFTRSITAKAGIQNTTCPTCSRKAGGYYEAILQFRCKIPNVPIDEAQVAKVERVRGGVDYYILSNNYAKAFASQLRRRGYNIKQSEKTFSRRDGREVYRVSYSIKEK